MLEGKDKSLNEQLLVLESILNKSKKIKEILRVLEQYSKENQDFKNYYLAAGCINQTIFNYYHNYDLDYGIGDYDIVYYDEDTSYEKEDIIIKDLKERLKHLDLKFDIKNEKRVHIWYNEKYKTNRKEYESVEDAISKWGTTITYLGVRMENNKLIVCAPYGLNDLFNLIIRPVKIDFIKEDYEKKVTKWTSKWELLKVIRYDE